MRFTGERELNPPIVDIVFECECGLNVFCYNPHIKKNEDWLPAIEMDFVVKGGDIF